MAGRREPSGRELLLVAACACVAAVVMHWPLVLNLGADISKDLGDPLPQAWQIAWGGHALANQPLDFFQSNQFWPVEDSLAYGDALIGYAPAGLIGSGPHDAVVRYDLVFLFAYALAFFGAYLLARELGIGPAGATVAGAAYAFAPFRLEQDGHLQVISSGGIPLCLALGARGVRLSRPWWLFAAWLVAGWQLSLGFALGLPLAYLLAAGGLAAAALWWRRGRPSLDRRLLAAGATGLVCFIAIAALIARPYFQVAEDNPEAKRPPSTIAAYSGQPEAFLAAPDENFIWGDATAGIRDGLENVPEQTLFPGLLILGLAIAGLWSASLDRRLRIGLGAGAVAVSMLALGFEEGGGPLWPYRVLYEVLPGWEALRTPGRLFTFSSLCLAMLAAAGADSLLRAGGLQLATRFRVSRRGVTAATAALAALLALLIAVEGRGLPFDPGDYQEQPAVPYPPASTAEAPAPQFHLPAERPEDNRRYLLWSTDGFPEMVNGRASTNPDLIEDLVDQMAAFPDPATVDRLRGFGVRSVVLHTDRAAGSPQEDAAAASIAELPLARRRLSGGLLVYELRSPSAGSGPSPGSAAAAGTGAG